MKPPAPKPKKLIMGPNSNKFSKALEKPKVVKPTGPEKKTSRPVTGTGTSSGTQNKFPTLPKSTKMSESAKKVTITGSAKGTKTPTAAQVNAATRNGMKISSRTGSTAAKNEKMRPGSKFK
jgi:hypothetical protein